MKLVHLSDLHLGFRQFQRQTPAGINQREADVARAFSRAVDRTIEIRPDLVLFAGDIFHNVRPTNPAILHAFIQLVRLTQMLPDAIVVMVAGNHDTPRTSETGCILKLFSQIGVTVVDGAARRIPFRNGELSVLAVPDSFEPRPALTPDASAKYNVLLMHGEVEGVLPRHGAADRSGVAISRDDLAQGRWDYIALGHYHVYHEVFPNAYYAGSIEYTSSNFWEELNEERRRGIAGKGMIEHDLDTGEHRFHPLGTSRGIMDLAPLAGGGLGAQDLDAAIRHAVDNCDGGIADKIVRLIVRDVPRHVLRELDHRALREFKRSALHFHLDARKPDAVRGTGFASPGRRASLAETVRDKLRERVISPDLDRSEFVKLGLHYMQEAENVAALTAADGTG